MNPGDIAALCKFVGYGSVKAPLVFLGIEEKGRHPDEYQGDIDVRVGHYDVPVMDMRDAHDLLHRHQQEPDPNPFEAPEGKGTVEQWITAAHFSLALLKPLAMADHALTADVYWREHLGRAHGQTLLAECFPVPRPRSGTAVKNYDPREVWDRRRLKILRKFFGQSMPLFVVAYGKPTWECVWEVFGEPVDNRWIEVHAEIDGEVDGEDQVAGNVCLTQRGVVVCCTPFFGRGLFNRDWIPLLVQQMHTIHLAAQMHASHLAAHNVRTTSRRVLASWD